MEEVYTVPLSKIINEFSLTPVTLPDLPERIMISNSHVNRLGLPLVGFYDHFEKTRIQLIGNAEHLYLSKMPEEERRACIEKLMAHEPAAVIFTSDLAVPEHVKESAEKYKIPVLMTKQATSEFLAALIASLNVSLAPRITRHGVWLRYTARVFCFSVTAALVKVKRQLSLSSADTVLLRTTQSRSSVFPAKRW